MDLVSVSWCKIDPTSQNRPSLSLIISLLDISLSLKLLGYERKTYDPITHYVHRTTLGEGEPQIARDNAGNFRTNDRQRLVNLQLLFVTVA